MMRRTLAALLSAAFLAFPPVRSSAAATEARAHWTVSAANPEAQALFDRGLLMLYAFSVAEARTLFAQAAQRDANLAMAYWGLAEADTIDINLPSTAQGERRGAEAVAEAQRRLAHATPAERALVAAIARRYEAGTQSERFARYADAMSAYAKSRPDEPNGLTVAAYALWNAEDKLTDATDVLTPRGREMLADLDRALALDPQNLGAHHLRIHLLEAAHRAQDAIPDAEALESYGYPLGTSHLPHMAAHVWTRLGDYARLVADNERACENDRAYFALGDGPGQEYMRAYHDHDVEFVLYGLTTVGRNDDARAFGQHEDARMRMELAIRLHDYTAALGVSDKSWAFPRALALAGNGDVAAARAERAKLSAPGGVQAALVDAAIAAAEGDASARVAAFQRAYDATRSGRLGDPKNYWATPIGEGYGAALLLAARAGDAERVFAAELVRFPNDPHLEFGLAEAQRAQRKDDTAARAAYRANWKGARDLTVADLG